jgi:hypothetical protein
VSCLTLRLKKNRDGTAALTCTRADGSATWQRQGEKLTAFFAPHDLTHYAVETVLEHRRGFLGLVAEGWDLDDFGAPWPRGPIPADADPSELIVGLLDAERACGAEWSAAEFNEQADVFCATRGGAPPNLGLTDDQLRRIRNRRAQLLAEWDAVPPGEALLLEFEPESFE